MIYYETDYLAHHGVKGMRWGVRKQRELKGRSRRQIAKDYKAKNANRVNAYKNSTVAKRNRSRNIGRAVGTAVGTMTAMYVGTSLMKFGSKPVDIFVGSAAAGIGANYVSNTIARGIANTAQGVNKNQLKKKNQLVEIKKI